MRYLQISQHYNKLIYIIGLLDTFVVEEGAKIFSDEHKKSYNSVAYDDSSDLTV